MSLAQVLQLYSCFDPYASATCRGRPPQSLPDSEVSATVCAHLCPGASIVSQPGWGPGANRVFTCHCRGRNVVPFLPWDLGSTPQHLMPGRDKPCLLISRESILVRGGWLSSLGLVSLCAPTLPLASGQDHLWGSTPINRLYSLLWLSFSQVRDA